MHIVLSAGEPWKVLKLERLAITVVAVASLGTAPAVAQIQAGNLVNVNVSQVWVEDILTKNNIDVDATAPIIVQLPILVAANVCDVAVNVLAGQATGERLRLAMPNRPPKL